MRRIGIPACLLAALTLVLSGCARGDDTANGGLVHTSWAVTSIGGIGLAPGSEPTLVFAPEGLTGSTGCNTYSTTFRTDGDRFTVGDATTTTDMACPGDLGGQEMAFLQALTAATGWRQGEDGRLTLEGGPGLVAIPKAVAAVAPDPAEGPALPLHGREWLLVAIDDVEDLEDVVPTLTLTADGRAEGFAGCNGFRGSYLTGQDTIEFGPLAATKMGCAGVAGLVEGRYLPILQDTTMWTIEDGRLTLLGPAGRLLFVDG